MHAYIIMHIQEDLSDPSLTLYTDHPYKESKITTDKMSKLYPSYYDKYYRSYSRGMSFTNNSQIITSVHYYVGKNTYTL